jgi:hypothetical protein
MQKTFSIILFCLIIIYSSNAQSKFNAGGSFDVNFPVGDFSNIAKTGTGFSVLGEFLFSENMSATLTVSYQSFKADIPIIAIGGETYEFSINGIPIVGGVRYYFDQIFFSTAIIGANLLKANADVSSIYEKDKISSDYQAKLAAGIGGGFRIPLAEQSLFEVSGIFQYVQDDFSAVTLSSSILILLDKL